MSEIDATFADFKLIKTRGQAQLVLEVPIEQADAALKALGGVPLPGAERWVTVRPHGAKAEPSPPAPSADAKGEKERRPFLSLPRSQQAALACDSAQFRHWLRADGKEDAAEWVRAACGVKSRSELDRDQRAAAIWDRAYTRYLTETGQIAEARG